MSLARTRDDPAARRARILDQAIRVIGERGYYGFTVQELAKSCGLSNAGLLYHFPSKQELFFATLRELEASEAQVMAPLLHAAEHARDGAEARAAVLDVFRTMVARSMARPHLLRLFAELQVEALDPTHPAHAWWRRRDRVVIDLFTKLLAPHITEPATAAHQVLAMIDGLGLRWLWAEPKFDPLIEWDRALARLLPELSTRGAPRP